MKQLKEWEIDKENLSRMKQKNFSLKMEVKAYHNRERSVIWAMLMFVMIVAAGYVLNSVTRM